MTEIIFFNVILQYFELYSTDTCLEASAISFYWFIIFVASPTHNFILLYSSGFVF